MTLTTTRTLVLALAALAAVGCDTSHPCHLVDWISGAAIEIERPDWTPGRYDIEVSYKQRGAQQSHLCAARIEAAEADGTLRGEVVVDEEDSNGSPATSAFCQPLDSDRVTVNLTIDRSLRLSIDNDTPERVHLQVREAGEPLLETDVSLDYEFEALNGPGCSGADRAEATVRLP